MFNALDIWLPAWLRRGPPIQHTLGVRHVLLCVCDHFEPFRGGVGKAEALARIAAWQRDFTEQNDGPLKHAFFLPIEPCDAEVTARIAELCRATGSECELFAPRECSRAALEQACERLADHGLLSRDENGAVRFGIMHGGAIREFGALREAGCLADFSTARSQPRMINSLFYAANSHESGRRVVTDRELSRSTKKELLIVQGPLAVDWKRRWLGVLPRLETGELSASNPPTLARLRGWLDCRIAVEGRPNWLFVKLHTRGADAANRRMLLGEPMRAFHRDLAHLAARDSSLRFHFVTARELVNILHAAEAGHSGDPHEARDFRYRLASAPDRLTPANSYGSALCRPTGVLRQLKKRRLDAAHQ